VSDAKLNALDFARLLRLHVAGAEGRVYRNRDLRLEDIGLINVWDSVYTRSNLTYKGARVADAMLAAGRRELEHKEATK